MDLKIRVMKIKGLLFGLFACAALAACTNDDIVENNGKGEQEKVKANLTLVIGAATNSSRAADNETGDTTDPGTGVESGVTDAVVLLHKEGKEFAFFLTSEQLNKQGSGTSITYEPQLTVAESGNYGVIVILNPCQEIKTAINSFIGDGTLPSGKESMYDYITSYEVKATTGDNPTSAIATDNKFMMVNKVAVAANVVSNEKDKPSTASVDVERVVSKITYMPTQTNNLYKVEDTTVKYTVTTTDGWRVENNIATYMTGMACVHWKDLLSMNIKVFIIPLQAHNILLQMIIRLLHCLREHLMLIQKLSNGQQQMRILLEIGLLSWIKLHWSIFLTPYMQ